MPSQPCLKPSALVTCPPYLIILDTLLNVFLAIAVDNLANAQELTKVSSLGSSSSLVPLGALQPSGLSPQACIVWLRPARKVLLGAAGQLESRTPGKEACFSDRPESVLGHRK